MPGPFLLALRGAVKNYAWGSRRFLARLEGRATPSPAPEAELWMGAHPSGPSQVRWNGEWISLRDAIASDPAGFLGAGSVARFGVVLPFLLKILAIDAPLSLQVHPDRERARAGFARERNAGVAVEAGNYPDDGAKPEMIVALEPLWLLRGLLEPVEIARRFAEAGIASMADATARLVERGVAGLRDFLGCLLGVAGESRSRLLDEIARAAETARGEDLTRDSPRFWLARLAELHPGDPTALAPLFLHLVALDPGQGSFQPPGVLHSYLEGVGVEVMASSDNVVRAGLTVKPVDVAELLTLADAVALSPVRIEAVAVTRREGASVGAARYPSTVEDFELRRATARPAAGAMLDDAEALVIGICTRGSGRVLSADREESFDLAAGGAFAARAGAGPLRLEGDLDVFVAAIAPIALVGPARRAHDEVDR